MKSLTVIGAGRVGRTLAHLWVAQGIFTVDFIFNRSAESTTQAAAFIGEGQIAKSFSDLIASDVFMLACQDDQIEAIADDLAASGVPLEGAIVFHVSGAKTTSILKSTIKKGAFVASVHPVKSFVDPAKACSSFAGTFCGLEGDEEALSTLREALEAIGAWTREIARADKPLYHAAPVFACNYLTTLLSASVALYQKAGIEKEDALRILRPLVSETVQNNWELGANAALTGPIARGDTEVVRAQLEILRERAPDFLHAYAALGVNTLALKQNDANAEAVSHRILSDLFAEILSDN